MPLSKEIGAIEQRLHALDSTAGFRRQVFGRPLVAELLGQSREPGVLARSIFDPRSVIELTYGRCRFRYETAIDAFLAVNILAAAFLISVWFASSMKRLLLLLSFCLTTGCAADGNGVGDYLFHKAVGDNYGPLMTGETRGEYHDRTQVEEHGYIKSPYHGH